MILYNQTNETPCSLFKGFYGEDEVVIDVKSNKSLVATFKGEVIELDFSLSINGIAYADTILSNGNHMSVAGFSRKNCEITIADKQNNEFIVYGLVKTNKMEYTYYDFLIPTSIAIVIMVVGKKVLSQFS